MAGNVIFDIRSIKFLVAFPYIKDFSIWLFGSQPRLVGKLKLVVKVCISARLADEDKLVQFQKSAKCIQRLSWIRYGSDGTRMQLYDSVNLVIGKMVVKQIDEELVVRGWAGDLSPAIVSVDRENGCIVEKWVRLRPILANRNRGLEVLRVLTERIHHADKVSIGNYIDGYSSCRYAGRVYDAAILEGVSYVEVSPCHGDLWHGNIGQDFDGRNVVFDWEYCGKRVSTYDAWFFAFSEWAAHKRPCDEVFYSVLEDTLNILSNLCYFPKSLRIIHLLHLFERYASHLDLGKNPESAEMQYLEAELLRVLNSQKSCLNQLFSA